MSRKLKFVTQSGSVALTSGAVLNLRLGDAWAATDPAVKEFPGFFADEPKKVHTSLPGESGPPPVVPLGDEGEVEDASAHPGKKSTAKQK